MVRGPGASAAFTYDIVGMAGIAAYTEIVNFSSSHGEKAFLISATLISIPIVFAILLIFAYAVLFILHSLLH